MLKSCLCFVKFSLCYLLGHFLLIPPSFNPFSKIGDSGVWGLKKNFALLELLERLQNGPPGQCGTAEEAIGLSGEVQILKREEDFVTFA